MEAAAQPKAEMHTEHHQAGFDRDEVEGLTSEVLSESPTAATMDFFANDNYDSKGQRISLLERAERLRQRLLEEQVEAKSLASPNPPKRSASTPLGSVVTSPRPQAVERPGTGPRSESMDTRAATPQTDVTDHGWAHSTAPTSIAMTPAENSQRTSSHVRQSGSASSVPKYLNMDAEWMRQELDRHRRTQEEARAQQELEDQVYASVVADSGPDAMPVHALQSPAVAAAPFPKRKPVPRPRADSSQDAAESRPSAEVARSHSRRQRSTPRSESRAELEILSRSGSRHSKKAREEPVPQMIDPDHIDIDEMPFGTITIHRMVPPPREEVQQPERRSRSLTRRFREYVRPGSTNVSRNVSAGVSRSGSRSRSIDSVRSAVSAIAPSFDSSTSKWRSFRLFNRRDSAGSVEPSRPGSADSHSRGRTGLANIRQSLTKQKTKPPIDLNRELPPLPSLDKWQDEEPEQLKQQHIATMVDQAKESESKPTSNGASEHSLPISPGHPQAPRSRRPHNLSIDTQSHKHPRDSFLNDMPVKPSAPPPAPPLEPTPSINPASLPTKDPESRDVSLDLPLMGSKSHVANYALSKPSPTTANMGRKVSQRSHSTPLADATPRPPLGHAKTESLHHSRMISSDDKVRTKDSRYRNKVEIPPKKSQTAPQAMSQKDKSDKKKWWKPGKTKKEKTWQDEVVRRGSNSGMIVTDDTEGTPIAMF